MKCNCCKSEKWTAERIGNLSGKNVVITGGNSGIGYYTALELGRAGANVIIACRDAKRGEAALAELKQLAPDISLKFELLDLTELLSVRMFAEKYLRANKPLDILINNAGIMALPERELTTDGFEMQFGTNHLGHFALTGLLLPALKRSDAPRVVIVSSGVANMKMAKIDLDNLQSEKSYEPMETYAQSKLANLAFMLELGRRYDWLTSVAAHPGATKSNLQKHKFKCLIKFIGQHGTKGAQPTIRAATDSIKSGNYYGPHCLQLWGTPVEVSLPEKARDVALNSSLWEQSARLTEVQYNC
jgi:NAD(P)-dependent dehydrogenase (short-subunit alcohol dehydrogenase family)